jgi:hypothetical protein
MWPFIQRPQAIFEMELLGDLWFDKIQLMICERGNESCRALSSLTWRAMRGCSCGPLTWLQRRATWLRSRVARLAGRNLQRRWRAFLVVLSITAVLQISTATGLMS